MSRVFLAEDTEHAREIVVKVIPGEFAGQVNIERFRREIKVAAKLQHPCIVPVLASGSADGLPYYTMPFVQGESLRARLSREHGLAVQDAVRILHDVSSALAYAHEQGVIHRDIKPDNIIVTKHHAVLMDFGVAKALTESTRGDATLTSVGMALGTPAYMAPEQATADPSIDHRADIYALGVVAYEMFAGRHPFEGRSSQAMLAAHTVEAPVTVAMHRPQLPPQVAGLIMRMLEKHPGDRPQSAEEVLAALEQVSTPTSQEAGVRQTSGLADRKMRKRLLVAGAAAGAVATILAISVFAFDNGSTGKPLNAGNVLILEPAVTGEVTGADADRILDAVNRGLSQVTTAHVVALPDESDSKSDRAALGRRAGAGKVIATSIYQAGDRFQIQFRLIDAGTGDIIRTLTPVRIARDPSVQELDSAIDPLLTVVAFSTSPLLGPSAIPLRGIPPFAVFTEFETALKLLVNPDPITSDAARMHLISAFARDTSFVQARLWQMWTMRASGAVRNDHPRAYEYDTLQAYIRDRRTVMSPFEAAMADLVGDRAATERGVKALHRILEMNPVSPVRRELPDLLSSINRPYAADSAMEQMLAADSSLNSVLGFWLIRAGLYHYVGDYRKSLAAARHARQIAPSALGPLRSEVAALAALGDTASIEQLLQRAAEATRSRNLFFDFAGDFYLSTAQELISHGHKRAGEITLGKAVNWFDNRSAAEWDDQSIAFRGALAYMAVGRLTDAERLLNPLLKKYPDDLRYKGAEGRLAAMMGDTTRALSIARQLAELPSEKFSGSPAFERAQIMAEMDRRDDAIALLQEAFGQGVGFTSYRLRIHTFSNFMRMLDYPPFRTLITPRG